MEVVAIDTWHDAKWRQRQFAFIQMTAALFLSPSEIKATKGNKATIYFFFTDSKSSLYPKNKMNLLRSD